MAITAQLNAINSNKELCARVCESVISRMVKCIEQNGWQFEHFTILLLTSLALSVITIF